MTSLTELRREATELASARSAITRCCLALGDRQTNHILAILNSTAHEIQDRIDIAEGTVTQPICHGTQ